MKEKTVKPGASATFEFKLTAPAKAGTYEEGFNVAAENFTWIAGTQVKIPITVTTPVAVAPVVAPLVVVPSVPTTSNLQPTTSTGPLAAALMIKSFQERVVVAGGVSAKVSVGFKNIGSVVWQTRVLRVRDTQMAVATSTAASLADSTWPNSLEPSRIREPISPGNVGFFDFNILGPVSRGDYTLSLKLVVDGADVPGATIDIPVTVTEDAPQLPTQEMPITAGATEPNIRVGLWNVPGGVTLLNSSSFSVVGSGGNTLATIPAGAVITAGYNRENKTVLVSTPNGQFVSPVPVRFVPTNPNGLFQVPNFAGWDTSLYVNQFRGALELNYYAPNDNVWLIEELPLEQYVQGLAETGNNSNHEFQKALVTIARNYAYFVHSTGGKYALFDVLPNAADQVYRAYGSETYRPNLVAAAKETRGQMVIYNDEIVLTPYFSRSDGRTRAWEEVWCCKVKPWLKSVPAPHDTGKTLWGHGVGLSAEDALAWAVEGKTYDWILKYYYTGTGLKRIY
jgi:peptidoglycan hydrolase-like amidase